VGAGRIVCPAFIDGFFRDSSKKEPANAENPSVTTVFN
jgi:hypothetical protein